ncbi:lactadherin-like [Patiria miniata]|uniref:F5/8 type C domain-containing protein n=1 Tax=Patiria miniata TaxID=46514 RepID=A0A914A5K4_PATMI|nr:lactadherin-like [Patiria miniata]
MNKVALHVASLIVMVSCHKICFIGSEYNPQSGIPPRWFLPYKDPCECTAIRLGGMHIPASSYSQGAPHYLKELFLSEDSDEIHAYFKCAARATCLSPLGMENGTIPDGRITASSGDYASCARLNNNRAWWATWTDANPWIEVGLAESTVVSGVTTQGSGYTLFVKQYKVAYKKQASPDFEHVMDGDGTIKEFIGNTDGDTPITNLFDESVVAAVVRIEPTEWHKGVGLRLELLGCHRE